MRSVLFALAFVSAQAIASQCEDDVQPTKQTPRLTFEMIEQSYPDNEVGLAALKLNSRMMQRFYYDVWPKIKERAHAQGRTVHDLVEEYFTLGHILMEEDVTISELKIASNHSISMVHLSFLAELENLGPSARMRDREWMWVTHTYSAFVSLAVLANVLESTYREYPTFHPLKRLSESQVIAILNSLENASLEHVARHIERRREQYDPKRVLGPGLRLVLRPIVGESIADELIRVDSTKESQLAVVLKNRMPFIPGWVYKWKDSAEDKYTMTLAPQVVRDSRGSDYDSIHKLLRGLIGGNRFKSGVKILSDIGPNIIEVKNYIAGHKRLIGCLDGRHLRILKLESMGDTKASYFKSIPKDLCL